MKTALALFLPGLLCVSAVHPLPIYRLFRPPGQHVAGPKATADEKGLLGPVHTVLVWRASIHEEVGKQVEKPAWLCRRVVFDERGNLVERTQYHENGLIDDKWAYTYTADGKPLELAICGLRGSLKQRNVQTYDDDGNHTGWIRYDPDGSIKLRQVCLYDDKGLKTEELAHVGGTALKWRYTHAYDGRGNETESAEYRPDGTRRSKSVRIYDVRGDVVERAWYNLDDSLRKREVCTRDACGRTIELAIYDGEGLLQHKFAYAYDYHGNKVREVVHYPDGYLDRDVVYSYEYDEVGNWTKRTWSKWVTKDDRSYYWPEWAEYRTIRYFPDDRER